MQRNNGIPREGARTFLLQRRGHEFNVTSLGRLPGPSDWTDEAAP